MGLTSWFRAAEPSSQDGASKRSKEEIMAQEMADIEDAFSAADLIINDDMEGAEARLKMGDSSYHQLALAVIGFVQSILGFEKDVMGQTSTQLADCQTRALADQNRAQREFAGCGNQIYPPGTEYTLVHTEAMLMSAVVGVMHESITEGIKSFYKLRKAYFALDAIMQIEGKRFKAEDVPRRKSLAEEYSEDRMPGAFSDGEFCDDKKSSSESVNRPGTSSSAAAAAKKSTDTSSSSDSSRSLLDEGSLSAGTVTKTSIGDLDTEVFTNPRDIFVHSGATMCFGSLLFMFTLVPPALSKLLNIIGFKGDRERGIRMLWDSTAFPNVHGAIAGVVLLSYYNGLLGLSDILPTDEHFDDSAEIVGLPVAKCEALLATMRERYPKSSFWQLEQSRMYANSRRLRDALDTLTQMPQSNMKQIDALAAFEMSMDSLFVMDWPLMRKSFLRCLELNDWSRTMYCYMIGIAELELYRDAVRDGDEGEARRRKKAAEEMFRKAPTMGGKKRFMAKQLPFELFVLRKLQKWEARAKEMGVDLADAVGVSPAQEMLYLWNGGKRVNLEQTARAIEHLEWDRCTAGAEKVEGMKADKEEAAVRAVCLAPMLRNQGKVDEARELLQTHVLQHDKSIFKGPTKDDYLHPCAHYETAVLAWTEACPPSGTDVSGFEKVQEEKPEEERETETLDAFRRRKVDECAASLERAALWEAFVLDARCGMRVQTGLETVKWFRRKMGWVEG